jgi:hypothetical protein
MTPKELSERARTILAEECMQRVFEDVRQGYLSALEQCAIGDIDTQHQITLSLQNLKQIKLQLMRYGQENVIDNHKREQESFMRRMRQTLLP